MATEMTLDQAIEYVEDCDTDEAAEESIIGRLGPILLDYRVRRQVIRVAWEDCRDEILAAIAAHAEEMRRIDEAMARDAGN